MNINSELKYIFSIVNEMLKFGEGKHLGLIVFNIALCVAFFADYERLAADIGESYLRLGAIAFVISIFVSFLSLFPNTRNLFRTKKLVENPNLLFYGDLAQIDINIFTEQLKTYDESFSPNKMDRDLMHEILINSQITMSKFNSFKVSLFFNMLALLIVGIPLLIKVFTS